MDGWAAIALLLAATVWVVAHMPALAMPEVGNATATAILGWYAWHTASRTIPVLVNGFREEMAAERIAHRADREALLKEMAHAREMQREDNRAIVAALSDLTGRLSPTE